MSIKWMAWVWENSPYAETKLLVHLALADHANPEGFCWPKQKTLAKMGKCGERYVREIIKDLKDRGLLLVYHRPGTSNLYRLKEFPQVGDITGPPEPIPEELQALPDRVSKPIKPSGTIKEPPSNPDTDSQDELVPDDPVYVDVGDEFGDKVNRNIRPKWQHPKAEHMKYMAPWKRKWFHNRGERSKANKLILLLEQNMIDQEWVDFMLKSGTKPRSEDSRLPRWSYDGFLNVVTDVEKYREWRIKVDNAKRHGEDASFDPTDLESIDARYEE